jgi:hypothetical protein
MNVRGILKTTYLEVNMHLFVKFYNHSKIVIYELRHPAPYFQIIKHGFSHIINISFLKFDLLRAVQDGTS